MNGHETIAMDVREKLALRILRDALDSAPAERMRFVSQRCEGDDALRERVASLIRDISGSDVDVAESDEPDLAPAADGATDALIGTQLGAFRVVERIGRGGMGIVYRGERVGADFAQDVALKLIRRGFDFDDVHARFLRERRILAQLSHPNLARFIDGGVVADGRPWFALEFVRGQRIDAWCDAHRLDIRSRLELFLSVCAAVQYAHTQLVVHRDLKPGNVLVDESGSVRLLDFGVAGLLSSDTQDAANPSTIGVYRAMTPEYAAPEQFAGGSAGVSADVYSLGVLVYQLIAGVLPCEFDRRDAAEAERSVRTVLPESLATAIGRIRTSATMTGAEYINPPVPQEDASAARLSARRSSARAYRALVRGDLTRIVQKALAKEPQRRYPTVQAFSDDLARWLAGSPVHATGDRFGYRLGKFVTRNRRSAAVAAALALGLVVALGFALQRANEARQQRDRAVAESARSDAVRDYVTLMFRDAGQGKGTDTLSAREVLKQGAETIFSRFADEPKTGQLTALMLAGLYHEIGDNEGAEPLLQRLLAWPDIEQNPDVLADARALLANLDSWRGKTAQARALLDQAQAYWQAHPDRYAERLNQSRQVQAKIEQAEGRPANAITTLRDAIEQRRGFSGSAPDRESAMLWMALEDALMNTGGYADALHAGNEAIALLERLHLQRSQGMLEMLAARALVEGILGQIEEPIADLRRAIALRQELYGPSQDLAIAKSALADMLYRRGDYAESVENAEAALELSIRYNGADSNSVHVLQSKLAERYLAVGEVAKAEPLAEAALLAMRKQFGEKGLHTGNAYRARARVNAARHRLVQARADLAAATAIYTELGAQAEPFLKRLTELHAEFEDPPKGPAR
jgi:serine/threonine-protein kinase